MKEHRELHLHKPNPIITTLERLHVYEIQPKDICPENELASLYSQFPDLAGDRDSFDRDSQSWKNNPGWWKRLTY